jgi:hypothetical protein
MDYSYGRGQISNPLNRHLQEYRGFAPTTVSTIFFFNVNTAFLLGKLLQKNFQAPLDIESGQNKLI